MGNNDLKNTNDILVKVDQNNLIYIDPNSVLNRDGRVEPRGVETEDLTMYVNLEADLIPRTTLIGDGDESSLRSIAGGTLNFLQNKDGRDYDTKWTDAYHTIPDGTYNFKNTGVFNEPTDRAPGGGGINDSTAQSFGITDISIQIAGANFIPRIVINFVDVRGKTLFESPENSPYGAFFHLPWPIFYLTVKGFFGKAVKYRLHLVKFNTRFNSSNGNMEVETNFVGSTYAYMADISLQSILNAPYFYVSESETTSRVNEDTKQTEIVVSKSTKGYRILKSVYQEYKSRGLLPEDFPVRTLRELIIIAGRLNKTLEQEIFSSVVDPKILAGVKDFEDLMVTFEGGIAAWKKKNLSPEYFLNGEKRGGTDEEIRWNKLSTNNKNSLEKIVDPRNEGTLERVISTSVSQLENNVTFGNSRNNKLIKDENLTIKPISFSMLKNIEDYYVQEATVGVDINGVEDALYTVFRNFIEQRNKLEEDIENRMNDIVKDKTLGIGFEPTIRNIIGVVLANADTYVRIMKDVHVQAFENADERKKILSGVLTDSDKQNECIYPWPEVKALTAGDKEMVLLYPGSREMLDKLKSYDKKLWPEVEFVENFYDISTKKQDALSDEKNTQIDVEYVFDTQGSSDKIDISVLTNVMGVTPYNNKAFTSVLYELYERAKYTTSYSPFDNKSIIELGKVEFENIKNQLSEDVDVVGMLKENILTPNDLLGYMASLSTYEKYPYYLDQLPTTWYFKDRLSQDYTVTKYIKNTEKTDTYDSSFTDLSEFLLKYKAEDYRHSIYPFNASWYSGYTGNDLKLNGMLDLDTPNEFIASPVSSTMWVKDGFDENLFENTINIDGTEKHILNTPYFHNQLYSEFIKTQAREKYVGSSYLLLNSLPFKDLDETIEYTYTTELGQATIAPTLMSTVFKEIGATHTIPYHMMIKWGSIYHRYKKYLEDGIDIIDGVTDPIDGSLFYSGGTGTGYEYNEIPESIGYHPYYETVFHQIVNGISFFNPVVDGSYEESIVNEITHLYPQITDNEPTYTSFVDDTKFATYSGYTLLPTNGYNDTYGSDFERAVQENFRILWSIGTDDQEIIDYSGYTFPTYGEYFKDEDGDYSLEGNYRKVVDLIATFKPDILDVFEQAFLNFAGEKLDEEITYTPYDVSYPKFQDLLKEISKVTKLNSDSTDDLHELMKNIKDRQGTELTSLSGRLLSSNNLVKIVMANPREIDNYVLGGFTGVNVAHFSTDPYVATSNNIELYLGEDVDGYYENFFSTMDISTSDENIKQFRLLVYIYAGLRANGTSPTEVEYVKYLKDNLIDPNYGEGYTSDQTTGVSGQDKRLYLFLNQVITQFKDLETPTLADKATKQRGYNDDPLKLELYNYFKSFNDKWTAGNSIGQRTLLEEFLFLDKANRDIGNDLYLDMQKITRLSEPGNEDINLFSLVGLLVHDSGIDIRALPAYVNFYGNDFTNSSKTMPSKEAAQTMFGTFLEVDHQDASPKVILQYIGPTSKHLELSDIDKKQKFRNDGFDVGDVNNNPIIVAPDVFRNTDFTKSNKVVAFEVSFGDQNQSIFKGVELDQATLKNTSESFEVLERLGRNETGSSTSQIDIGLFNIYRQSSYQCTVTCMGNVMIQPTMYFYIKNIPLFRGSYLITEVTHNIKTTGIETSFKGTRIPQESLPNPTDSFLASYRPLFDKIIRSAKSKISEEAAALQQNSGTAITLVDGQGNAYTTDPGTEFFEYEKIKKEADITDYGIPYNGKTDDMSIQLITYDNPTVNSTLTDSNEWLRAIAVTMGGQNYPIDDETVMSIASNLTDPHDGDPRIVKWGDIKNLELDRYYSSKFIIDGEPGKKYVTPDNIINDFRYTEFINPRYFEPKSTGKHLKEIEEVETYIGLNSNFYRGPINVGPALDGFGVGLAPKLMQRLGLIDGQVVYFRMVR